jgi:hypothetical protein
MSKVSNFIYYIFYYIIKFSLLILFIYEKADELLIYFDFLKFKRFFFIYIL